MRNARRFADRPIPPFAAVNPRRRGGPGIQAMNPFARISSTSSAADASGILLSGGSMANITALAVARNHQLGLDVRKSGLKAVDGQMTLYY